MPFTYFTQLAQELQQEIIRQCDVKDLTNLSRTSHITHKLCHPTLYHTVDISVHNVKGGVPDHRPPYTVEADNPCRAFGRLDFAMFRRQQLFIRTIMEHSKYGKYVRSFTWTLITPPQTDDGLGYVNHWKNEVVWQTFGTFTSVQEVSIAFLTFERETDAPSSLFSSASSVRLVGRASYRLVSAILHSVDPAKLTSLTLDNLQDFGQRNDGKDLPYDCDLCEIPETFNTDGTFRTKHPGPMRGHLRYLKGRCTALKHLSMRSVGQDDSNDYLWSATNDEERYNEWAAFLQSVTPTLQSFTFEQGFEPDGSECIMNRPDPRPLQTVRPMDARFIKYILPVILGYPWPHLKIMFIRGVGGQCRKYVQLTTTKHYEATVYEVEGKIRAVMGSEVPLTYEREATQTFGLGMDGYCYED
ncbi:MAG: hypothetical protein M1830_009709 [Pleopsidium flavum]|nr:MAG: hypothetical protein M1830_009709 [Pleopsidium flavum]